MEYYLVVKKLHILTAIISVAGFILRAWWLSKNDPLLQHKAVKVLPHINDTLLLAAAIYLSVVTQLYPFQQGWLGAKVIFLIGYVIAGSIALKPANSAATRRVALLIALVSVGLIFFHALQKPVYW